MKNKKILSLILGTAMIASMPLAGVKAEGELPDPVGESNQITYNTNETAIDGVVYGGFADLGTDEESSTDIVTAIPEYTLTIPADTAIKRGALQSNIGKAKVDGKYFFKPYGVDLSMARTNFKQAELDSTSGKYKYKTGGNEIKFTLQDKFGPLKPQDSDLVWDTGAAYADRAYGFVTTNSTGTDYRYSYHLYKNNDSVEDYDAYKISEIHEDRDVVVNIPEAQWTALADDPAKGGVYHGSITFTAEICANTTFKQGKLIENHTPTSDTLPESQDIVTP